MTHKPSAKGISTRRSNGPSCRGGVSSLLRVARPGALQTPRARRLPNWVQRAAAYFGASVPQAQTSFGVSEYGVGSTG
ncbi:MAG: hypothetical protein WA210_16325 [Burkholderiaceae bacterium]